MAGVESRSVGGRAWLGFGVLVATLVSATACAVPANPNVAREPASEGCKQDADCKANRECHEGKCVAPSGIPSDLARRIENGEATLDLLRAAVGSRDCREFPGLADTLSAATERPGATKLVSSLVLADESERPPMAVLGEWLLLVERREHLCDEGLSRKQMRKVSTSTGAYVDEGMVDKAVRATDCSSLAAINSLALWPFEARFVSEVADRKFGKAEVTRRLWLETLEMFSKECSKRMSRREVAEVEALSDKLSGIVGLDDEILIGLRSKLMEAMEKSDAESVRLYLASVTEREKLLDSRNAAAHEAKMRTIEASYASANHKEPKGEQGGSGDASGEKPADQIRDAVETTKAAVEAADVARSLFGF